MDFKEIKTLDDLYYNFRRYHVFVVDGYVGMSYNCLTEDSSVNFVKERLEKIKTTAMEYDLKLISDYMEVRSAGLEYWFNMEVPRILDPDDIHNVMGTYIEEIKSNYSFGKYPKLRDPREIGYHEYFKQLVNYTRKLNDLYKQTEKDYMEKEQPTEKSPYSELVNEIKDILK